MKKFQVVLTYPVYLYHVVEAEDQTEAKHMARNGEGFRKSVDGDFAVDFADDYIETIDENHELFS